MKKWSLTLILVLLICLPLSGCRGTGEEAAPEKSPEQSVSLEETEEEQNSESPAPAESASGLPDSGDSEEETSLEPGETQMAAESLSQSGSESAFDVSTVSAYTGEPYVAVHGNEPYFTQSEITTTSFESYSELDSLGRCGVAFACVGQDLMPTEARGNIGMIQPTGWHSVKYDNVDGGYLYNRCHLLAYELTGENANEKNLITGTRYFNVTGMLPFENMVADYVKETDYHVMYRVTPIFEEDNLVAGGVLMEGWSVEDEGDGICFCVYVYNVQPGITIDYATGDSWLTDGTEETGTVPVTETETPQEDSSAGSGEEVTYILNTNTKKFHYPDCSSVSDMKESNREEFTGTRDEVIARGYSPCGNCKP